MILVDANLLVYAHVRDLPQHSAAHAWLDRQLNSLPRVGLPWPSLLAFVRLVTNPRIFENPSTVAAAWGQVESWLTAPDAWIPLPGDRHAAILGRLVGADPGLRADLIPDAHLAALALEHGLTLCSCDGDFARFPDLAWNNPLL